MLPSEMVPIDRVSAIVYDQLGPLDRIIKQSTDSIINTHIKQGVVDQKVSQYRSNAYQDRMPYFLSDFYKKVEHDLDIDARSYHIHIEILGEIVGSLRVTCAPFEFKEVLPVSEGIPSEFDQYIELSRLIVDHNRWRADIGKLLITRAIQLAFDLQAKGIVALCKRPTAMVFSRYGLEKYHSKPIIVASRHYQPYYLMHTTLRRLIMHIDSTTHNDKKTTVKNIAIPVV
ncbi:GNAT family N-acetyltransferase [Zooshikella harenae]|uniref:GNAT family N-acetyltransferase n=1 Tax=Zooshikella harenae TaxID=2827238 RepID=A0ABS5ZBU4_9GAMM|nr:GNAT family N-acetyltransferase [Zooshikella harenae]MBU2711445.1 GNAT family N-acetyltransferase [Zooshikella harenae]